MLAPTRNISLKIFRFVGEAIFGKYGSYAFPGKNTEASAVDYPISPKELPPDVDQG